VPLLGNSVACASCVQLLGPATPRYAIDERFEVRRENRARFCRNAPALFDHLIETGSPWALAAGYMFAASLMLAAAVAEARFGIDAEMRSLERIADPLSSE